ncbi:glycoside hydrolase family 3 C-terminal domain-containing protein [Agromyces atrinae]|uniref:beta-glucosidase family protein n=1 Tax=Agromyces atrinae TaxID=592376 RepID=UPI001F561075|nr:glycoside hydrolase family 3 C-terminal domain-containing protein [Agromyces atrinae]MCI2957055.1 glycoside hydrolase family 3 C-terminal domain-containing protein [Agromyces atrinae]
MTRSSAELRTLLDQLTLDEKVALISGADFWTTVPLPSIGLRAMVLSDGPAGVRGPVWDERSPSINLPSATALAASWDTDLAHRYGAVAASEARRKGVDVVLGPTINLHRSPLGGRHFECFSEDPFLSGVLGASYVRGLQDNGVAATPKHYVANDSETDRFTVDVRVDERALRELYLLPFEHTVEAGAWAIMSSYNSVDGVTLTENDLLETPLNSEWGFDGVVVSDWTAVRSLASASASQDLAMPGPAPAWSGDLIEAVRSGDVAEADVDRKALRLLALADRVGALGGDEPVSPAAVDGVAFAREAAAAGTVLLTNDGVLPLEASSLGRVAVIGHNAREARTQGGGSATVLPEHVVSPLEGIRAALPGVTVDYAVGAVVQEGVSEIPLERLTNPVTGEPGLIARFEAEDGTDLFSEDRRSTALVWFGGDAPVAAAHRLVLHTTYTPDATENVKLGFATSKHGRVFVDGELLVDESPVVEGTDLGAAFLAPPSATGAIAVTAGVPLDIRAEFDLRSSGDALQNAFAVTLGFAPDDSDTDALLADAVTAATGADVAIVVVGTNSRVESEGYDRSSLDLPGRQGELVRAVVAANPNTIVIVNAGSPVALPWVDAPRAIVLGYFGGQQMGSAVADVLFGAVEPGGRLTTTWAAELDDVPVVDVTPTDGVLRYEEGIHIGYRAWLRGDIAPLFPFGHGLGYTTWSIDEAAVHGSIAAGDARFVGTATNTGDRAGKHVVQVYAERTDSAIERPERWLVGFAVVRAGAGETVEWEVALPKRAFAHWADGWQYEEGTFTLFAGSSVVDLARTASIDV